MKIRSLVTAVFCFMCFTVLSGCGSSDPAKTDLNDRPESVISEADGKETGNDIEDKKKPSVNEKKAGEYFRRQLSCTAYGRQVQLSLQ